MKTRQQRIEELRAAIPAIEPKEALRLQTQGAVLIDVRESDEVAQGTPAGSLHLSRSFLELSIEERVADRATPLVLLCASGMRSLFAAEGLRQLGYEKVYSLAGGFDRWKNEGLPFEIPKKLDADARARYARHLRMPDIGEKGQLKLLESRVLVIGAGGLGSPAALYLAAAGIGTLGILDHDVVDRSNLQRQVLHNEARIGTLKVDSARQTLEALNPSIRIVTHNQHLTTDNAIDILRDYDVIVDGSDNLETRYAVNDACLALGLPNIHGAVYRFEGKLTVFWPAHSQDSPCYRCLFPAPDPNDAPPSCAVAGVLGVLPGVIGLLQAIEAVKIILGLGAPLVGKMLYYDALAANFMHIKLKPRPSCRCRAPAP